MDICGILKQMQYIYAENFGTLSILYNVQNKYIYINQDLALKVIRGNTGKTDMNCKLLKVPRSLFLFENRQIHFLFILIKILDNSKIWRYEGGCQVWVCRLQYVLNWFLYFLNREWVIFLIKWYRRKMLYNFTVFQNNWAKCGPK